MTLDLAGWIALFTVSAMVVVAGGVRLARSGDEIARRTGIGGLLMGTVLLAGATSLPELATEVSAALAGSPDLAVGDLLGSSMANMAILGLIDLVHRRRVWHQVGAGHARVGAIAIGLTAIVLLGILRPTGIAIGWVGLEPILVVVAYVAATAWLGRSLRPRHQGLDPSGEIIAPTGWAAADERRRTLRAVTPDLAVLGVGAILLMAIALSAVAHGHRTAFRRMEPDAVVLLGTYLVLLAMVGPG